MQSWIVPVGFKSLFLNLIETLDFFWKFFKRPLKIIGLNYFHKSGDVFLSLFDRPVLSLQN